MNYRHTRTQGSSHNARMYARAEIKTKTSGIVAEVAA